MLICFTAKFVQTVNKQKFIPKNRWLVQTSLRDWSWTNWIEGIDVNVSKDD